MRIIDNLKEFIINNKIKVLIAVLVLMFIIVMMITNKNKDEHKVYDNRNYIYTSEIKDIGGIKSKLPLVNLYGEEIDILNKDIMGKYYTENLIGEKYMDYEYYKNNNILSLIVKLYYLESNDYAPSNIYFYNIDINEGTLISNEELLSIYNISTEEVENELIEHIEEYYNYEVDNNYISGCDINCYKDRIGSNLLEDISYYVKDNNIYAYKYFLIDRNLAYDENKPFDLFRFKIS